MKTLKLILRPFAAISRTVVLVLVLVEAAVALLAWDASSGGMVPGPGQVAGRIWELVVGTEVTPSGGSLAENFVSSFWLTCKGMALSMAVALALAYMSVVPAFRPVAAFVTKSRYLTMTGLAFLFTQLTANAGQLKLTLLMFGIVPFFVTSLLNVIRDIPEEEYDLCATMRMGPWRTLWESVVMGRLDSVFDVLRQNFAISWMMITMVEGLAIGEGGLGAMIIKENKYLDLTSVFAVLAVIFAVGVIFDWLIHRCRWWLFPYTR